MINEILLGLLIQTKAFFNPVHTSNSKPEIQISHPAVFPQPSFTPTPTPKPKYSPVVKSAQTTSFNFTTQSVLKALNDYRNKNGVGGLQVDDKLQTYAQSRADYLQSIGKLDDHAQHIEFMASGGFDKLGFNSIAENQGWNYQGDAKGLIESFYGTSSGHNKNQLNPTYTHVGIGIDGSFTDLVFGGRKR